MVRSGFLKFSAGVVLLGMGCTCAADAINLTPGVNAGQFSISPDARHIVFEVYEAPAGRLYSAPTDASALPVPLSPNDGGSAFVFNSQISRDGSTVVYDRNEFPDGIWHVGTYASRIDGSAPPVLLNRSKVYDDDPSQYSLAISNDGHFAAIRADQGDRVFDALGRPTDASTPSVMLNPGPHSNDSLKSVSFNVQSAGNRVVFHIPGGDDAGVFSRPFDGSEPSIRLSPQGGDVPWYTWVLSQDQSKVLIPSYTGSGRQIRVASVQDGQSTLLFSKEDSNQFGFVRFTADGKRAVFSLGAQQYSAPVDGSAPAAEFGPYPTGQLNRQELSADSRLVAYLTQPEIHQPTELYVSPIDGSGLPKKLAGGLPEGMNFMEVAPDGEHVVFFDSLANFPNLMSVPSDGSAPAVKLWKNGNPLFTRDGKMLIVAAYDVAALYLEPLDGGEGRLLASNPYGIGEISQFELSPDGSMVIFRADDGVAHSGIFAVAVPEPSPGLIVVGAAAILNLRKRRESINPQ